MSDRNPAVKRAWIEGAVAPKHDGCMDWPWSTLPKGYGQVAWGGTMRQVHALVCEMAHGPRPAGLVVAHSCGRPICCSARHLRWATRAENEADKIAHGTTSRGERSRNAKLTTAQVLEIRALGESVTQADLADRYGVNQVTIHRILTRKRWTHV